MEGWVHIKALTSHVSPKSRASLYLTCLLSNSSTLSNQAIGTRYFVIQDNLLNILCWLYVLIYFQCMIIFMFIEQKRTQMITPGRYSRL